MTLSQALGILKAKGVINSPNYWEQNAKIGGKCEGEYVQEVLIKIAGYFKTYNS